MKKTKLLTALVSSMLVASLTYAQSTFSINTGNNFIQYLTSAKQTFDGGYIIVGSAGNFSSHDDIYLIKLNPFGDTLWTKSYVGFSLSSGKSVIQMPDSGFVICAITPSFSPGNNSLLLIKTDASGNIVWQHIYVDSSNSFTGGDLQPTNDGGFIVVGNSNYAGAELVAIKFNNLGVIDWKKGYTSGVTGNNLYGSSICQALNNEYVITGHTNFFGAGTNDYFLIKLDSAGTLVWSKAYGGAADDQAHAVTATDDGGYIVAGTSYSFGAGSADMLVIKTDANGDTTWTKTYGASSTEECFSVRQTSDKGFVLAGNSNSFTGSASRSYYFIKTDSIGTILWSFAPGSGGTDFQANDVHQTTDSGYILIVGDLNGSNIHSRIIKTASSGQTGCPAANVATLTGSPPLVVTNAPTFIQFTPVTMLQNFNYTVKAGGTFNKTCFTVGIDNLILDAKNVFVYPNPFDSELLLSGTKENGNVIIVDVLGKEILNQKTNNSETKIKTEKLSQGIYLLKYTEGNRVADFKLLKF